MRAIAAWKLLLALGAKCVLAYRSGGCRWRSGSAALIALTVAPHKSSPAARLSLRLASWIPRLSREQAASRCCCRFTINSGDAGVLQALDKVSDNGQVSCVFIGAPVPHGVVGLVFQGCFRVFFE